MPREAKGKVHLSLERFLAKYRDFIRIVRGLYAVIIWPLISIILTFKIISISTTKPLSSPEWLFSSGSRWFAIQLRLRNLRWYRCCPLALRRNIICLWSIARSFFCYPTSIWLASLLSLFITRAFIIRVRRDLWFHCLRNIIHLWTFGFELQSFQER